MVKTPSELRERIQKLQSESYRLEALVGAQNKEIARLREENAFLKEQNKRIAELRMRGWFGGGLGRPYL